ncbi:hypothetical protein Trydic_g13699 [Trypoxylus dichotomus]
MLLSSGNTLQEPSRTTFLLIVMAGATTILLRIEPANLDEQLTILERTDSEPTRPICNDEIIRRRHLTSVAIILSDAKPFWQRGSDIKGMSMGLQCWSHQSLNANGVIECRRIRLIGCENWELLGMGEGVWMILRSID